MKRIHSLFTILVFVLTVSCFFAAVSTGIEAQEVGFQGLALPFKKAVKLETSAIEPIGDGTNLLVANDKTSALLIVDAKKREVAVQTLTIQSEVGVPRWEAMAKDAQNNYYLYGVNAGLFRFHLKDETKTNPTEIEIEGTIEKRTITAVSRKCSDSRIEGLAIWINENKEQELVFGIREDCSDIIYVYRAKFTKNNEPLSLKPFFQFTTVKVEDAENVRWHLSSIEYVPDWRGFLVVTSTEDAYNKFYGNMLCFVSEEKLKGSYAKSLKGEFTNVIPITSEVFEPAMKAEGLAILPTANKAKLRAVIVFDNDYDRRSTDDPSALAFADLSKP